MKVLLLQLVVAVGAIGLAPCASAGIRTAGKYNGVVIFDRWGGCHLFGGVYVMEVSESVKEMLRPYDGQAILVDAKEVWQPANPGDGLITALQVLGPAEEPNTKTDGGNAPPLLDGLDLSAAPNFRQGSGGEFVITLRNKGPAEREIEMGSLGPTLFARKKKAGDCTGPFWGSPSDGPSYAAATRRPIPFLYAGPVSSCGSGNGQTRVGLFVEPGLVFAERLILAAGESIEVPIRFELTPGEYEFVAGYGGSVHAARVIATKKLGFDVDAKGRAHLVGDAVQANLNRQPARVGPVCGRVELPGGGAASGARVYAWPYPLEKHEPRAVSSTAVDADGIFRFGSVREGNYILTSTLERPVAEEVLAGVLGGVHSADAPAAHLPDVSGQPCALQIRLSPQPVYSVAGRTAPANPGSVPPVRKVRVRMIAGDAYPFEAETIVQTSGRYEFRRLPAGAYQFFAGSTGSGFELKGPIEDLGIRIRWPDLNGVIGASSADMDAASNQQNMANVTLIQVHHAEKSYAERYGNGFSANFGQLGPSPYWSSPSSDHAGLFDPMPNSDGPGDGALTYSSQGYRFTYAPGGRDPNGKITSYQVTARPMEYGKTGVRSFWMDESGTIRRTEADRSATRRDPKAEIQ